MRRNSVMIELWGRGNAYNVLGVLWTLDELALDYRHHDLGSRPGCISVDIDPGFMGAINQLGSQ